nr:DUF2969 domain-containing protein [Melissococcus plutonius]
MLNLSIHAIIIFRREEYVKKNKDIEIRIEEGKIIRNNQQYPVNKLFIGKKEIGQTVQLTPNKIAVELDGKQELMTKTINEAFEYIIRQWNLNN